MKPPHLQAKEVQCFLLCPSFLPVHLANAGGMSTTWLEDRRVSEERHMDCMHRALTLKYHKCVAIDDSKLADLQLCQEVS